MDCLRRLSALILILSAPAWASGTTSRQIDTATTTAGLSYTFSSGAVGGTPVVSAALRQEVPSGSINSSNTSFTLAYTPAQAASLVCWLDGEQQNQGTDYTLATATLTFATAPATGQILICTYSRN